jgi:hypothetical protein
MIASRRHHLPAFPDVVREGLFHVHIIASLARPNRCQSVPVVWCCDNYRVDVRVVQYSTKIHVRRDSITLFPQQFDAVVEDRFVDIAHGDDFRAGNQSDLLEQLTASTADTSRYVDPTESDKAQTNIRVRPRRLHGTGNVGNGMLQP